MVIQSYKNTWKHIKNWAEKIVSDCLCHFVYVVWVYDRWWWICTKNSWLYKVNAFQSYQFDSASELAINLFHAQLWCLEIEDSGLFKRQFSKYKLVTSYENQTHKTINQGIRAEDSLPYMEEKTYCLYCLCCRLPSDVLCLYVTNRTNTYKRMCCGPILNLRSSSCPRVYHYD